MEEKSWNKVRKSLREKVYMEDTVGSEKRKRKERCGIREELLERGDEIKSEEKRLIEGSVRIGEENGR